MLHAARSIQSIVHKAIVTTLTGDADAHRTTGDHAEPQEIFVLLENDQAKLLVNTS